MRVRALVVASLVGLGGCYSPTVPSSGFTCSGGGDCPDGLSCLCGQCVSGPAAAACSFTVSVDALSTACTSDPQVGCAVENQPFPVDITAYSSAQPGDASQIATGYAGSVTLGSSWGHARVDGPIHFSGGVAHGVMVRLDRATPFNTTALLSATAGTATGTALRSITVDPAALVPEMNDVLDIRTVKYGARLSDPSIDHGPSGATLYFDAYIASAQRSVVGRAHSSNGIDFTADDQPFLVDPNGDYGVPSLLRLSDTDVRLFVLHATTETGIEQHVSSDGGATFPGMGGTLLSSSCPICRQDIGFADAWAMVDPHTPGVWLLYNTFIPNNAQYLTTMALARSSDQGASWNIAPIAEPSNGSLLQADLGFHPRVVYDRGIYRMYYLVPSSNPCEDVIAYATSEDGQFFTGTRGAAPFIASDVPWTQGLPLPVVGLVPGGIDLATDGSNAATLWFSAEAAVPDPMDMSKTDCVPFAIGRAHRS